MSSGTLAAHRLVLDAAEFALLNTASGAALPPGFQPESAPDEAALRAAASRLRERGVIADAQDCGSSGVQPVESVAANLAVLAAPVLTIRIEVAVHGAGLRAVYAVAGPLGASLLTLAQGAVELSMFPAVALGHELLRAVPEPPMAVEDKIGAALGGGATGLLAGRLPLASLDDMAQMHQADRAENASAVDRIELSGEELALAERAREATVGTLRALVTGRAPDGGVLVGQVVWLRAEGRWVGLRPDPDGTDRRMVTLVPVDRRDIGHWLAPFIAEVLEVAGDRAYRA
jgi:hypothetical protein